MTKHTPFYVPTSSLWSFQFLHILANKLIFRISDNSIDTGESYEEETWWGNQNRDRKQTKDGWKAGDLKETKTSRSLDIKLVWVQNPRFSNYSISMWETNDGNEGEIRLNKEDRKTLIEIIRFLLRLK